MACNLAGVSTAVVMLASTALSSNPKAVPRVAVPLMPVTPMAVYCAPVSAVLVLAAVPSALASMAL